MKKAMVLLLVGTLVLSCSTAALASPSQKGFSLNVVKRSGDLEVNGIGNSDSSYEYSLTQGGILGFDKKIRFAQRDNDQYQLSSLEAGVYHSLGSNLYLNAGGRSYRLKEGAGDAAHKFTLQAGVEYRQKVASSTYAYASATLGNDLGDYEMGLAHALPFATLDVNYRSEQIANLKGKDVKNHGIGFGLTVHF